MIPKKKVMVLGIVIYLILTIPNSVSGTSIKDNKISDRKVYLIVTNTLTLEDISVMSNVKKILSEGSIGLMNTRGGQGYDGPQGYMTINASSRAYANFKTTMFTDVSKEEKNRNDNRFGQDTSKTKIMGLNIDYLIKLNNKMEYLPYVGALGDNLHNNNFKTAVYGNSDTADSFIRKNCLIAMDRDGLVDYGNVDDILIKDKGLIWNYRTDYSKILYEINTVKEKASFFVIETGDLDRLKEYAKYLSEEDYRMHRKKIIKQIDIFLGNLIEGLEKEETLLMIVSPNGQDSIVEQSKLSPLILWGGDISKGTLISETTRRIGIVSNLDIAPSVSNYLKASNNRFIGNPVISTKIDNNFEYILQLNDRTNFISNLRSKILKVYGMGTIVVILLITSLLLTYNKFKGKYRKYIFKVLKYIMLFDISILPSLLLISFFKIDNYFEFFAYLTIILIVISLLLMAIKDKYRLIFLSGITSFIIIIDILSGGNLIKFSVLGYDPIIGARYFGIGNEMVGVLLGSTVVFCSSYMQLFNKPYYIFGIMGIIIISVLHPNTGANVGGSIAFVFMCITFVFGIFNYMLSLKKVLSICVIIGFSIVLFGIIDIFIIEKTSHLGNAILIMVKNNPIYVFEISIRKLKMNIRLLGITIWTKVLIVTLFSLAMHITALKDITKNIFQENRYYSIGLISILVGNLIGFLVNDSGIILASISNIYVSIFLMYVTIIRVEST